MNTHKEKLEGLKSTNKDRAKGIRLALRYLEQHDVYNFLKNMNFAGNGLRAIEILKEIAEDLESNN